MLYVHLVNNKLIASVWLRKNLNEFFLSYVVLILGYEKLPLMREVLLYKMLIDFAVQPK